MIERISTGMVGLDRVLDNLRLGDNVVWQVDHIEQYRHYVAPYLQQALADGRAVHYIRFGLHDPVVDSALAPDQICVHEPQADIGFEHFAGQVHQIIRTAGKAAFYVFDCLSDLLEQWSSDLMIGNFFRITCPYLFELDTIAYFALLRGHHSYDTIARIRETTQLLLDLYQIEGQDYIHPLKVWQRYAPTMFLPHKLTIDQCEPIISSAEASLLFSSVQTRQQQAERQIDFWDRLFLTAEQSWAICRDLPETDENCRRIFERLCGLLIGDEGRIGEMARKWFDLSDLIEISRRQIGTGKIGGKAVGMLLARKIIDASGDFADPDNSFNLEPHDSYYLGSDLFYTYIVHNGWWKLRMDQKSEDGYFSKAAELRALLLTGRFPDAVREKFQQMLEYFGQSPIIVRSSSLLEDDFGNAFAGKYESVFCANQGSPDDRFESFEQAVRCVYASMMDETALDYRKQRGLDQKDEQMALLVQRVSGSYHGSNFYPWLAGVGHSDNLYVWDERLDPEAGMLRIVFGLGTRAVDRVEGDYPKIVALDYPMLGVHDSPEAEKTYSQRYVDLLDLVSNQLTTRSIDEMTLEDPELDLSPVGDIDWESTRQLRELGLRRNPQWILNFRRILSERVFPSVMRQMMETLESAYRYPVDIEFTVNEASDGRRLINLLQCRPLQTRRIGPAVQFPKTVLTHDIFLQSKGHFMGGNVCLNLTRVIYIDPHAYIRLHEQDRHQVARIIGLLNQRIATDEEDTPAATMLIGPGRWGTTTPSLGIPVKFSEISHVSVLAEVSFETAGMMPEISFGSHFFLDLVEAGIFYVAVLQHRPDVIYNNRMIVQQPNHLADLLPAWKDWSEVIHVCDFVQQPITLFSDIKRQELLAVWHSGLYPRQT